MGPTHLLLLRRGWGFAEFFPRLGIDKVGTDVITRRGSGRASGADICDCKVKGGALVKSGSETLDSARLSRVDVQ